MEFNTDNVGNKFKEEKVFEELFKIHYKKLFNFIKSYIIDAEAARELVQEIFLQLWEIRSKLKPDSNMRALLFSMARFKSISYLRHLKARLNYLEYSKRKIYEYELNLHALNDSSSEKIIYEELNEKINSAINGLPPKCKKVFELSRFNDLNYKEIAQTMNISVKTVENQIVIALRRIHQQIEEYL